jgi:hypothetical protein
MYSYLYIILCVLIILPLYRYNFSCLLAPDILLRTSIGIIIKFLQQLTGINAIFYYSSIIFQNLGIYMYIYVCVHIYIYMYILHYSSIIFQNLGIYMYIYVCVHIYIYIYIYIYVYSSLFFNYLPKSRYLYVYIYMCTYIYIYICIFFYYSSIIFQKLGIYIYAFIYICIHICIYIFFYYSSIPFKIWVIICLYIALTLLILFILPFAFPPIHTPYPLPFNSFPIPYPSVLTLPLTYTP